MEEGADFIAASLQSPVEGGSSAGARVYVHCERGCSRSASVVLLFLLKHCGLSLLQAAAQLKQQRSASPRLPPAPPSVLRLYSCAPAAGSDPAPSHACPDHVSCAGPRITRVRISPNDALLDILAVREVRHTRVVAARPWSP